MYIQFQEAITKHCLWGTKSTLERPNFANFNSAKTSKITNLQTLISANISSFTVSKIHV